LLKIFPRQNDNEEELIRCSLSIRTLEKPLDFEFSALSYTWRNPTIRRDILIDGVLISVIENLEASLKQLR
ncbi:hypothetical protein BKA65DRAFT_358746, partial [Rhexocercosporidium sp. MPI-PUGE-AT-0058]